MAAYDIWVHSTVDEGASRRSIRTNISAATFETGEPVWVDLTGELLAANNGPGGADPASIYGIAAEPAVSNSNRMAQLEIQDTGRLIELPSDGKIFGARYSLTGAAGTTTVPTFANVSGVPGNLILFSGAWWFRTSVVANLNVEGVDVLDANGFSLGDDLTESGAGAIVLFRFL